MDTRIPETVYTFRNLIEFVKGGTANCVKISPNFTDELGAILLYSLLEKKLNAAMETTQFKTNIKCANCIATVTPFLNKAVGEGNWQVDTLNPAKLLTVSNKDAEKAQQAIEEAGYKAEILK